MNNINSASQESIEMMKYEDGGLSGASDDDDDNSPSSPDSEYKGQDLMNVTMDDEIQAQLAAAGPIGVAAAAAIASAKKRKRPHSFETNPSIRKRQQNRLLRKLRQTIFEFATRVGQQAVVLVATPGKTNTSYKVFGAKPLEDVVKNLKSIVMEELENALAQQAPPPPQEDPSLFELPPLIIDGIPTPVEKMTQAQLRAFIPLMLKYSTGRGKPGWGRESTRPPWWPKELPWANVRMDARTEEDKQKISWTHALRKIVINCYKYHGREDLLPAFNEEDEKANILAAANSCVQSNAGNVGVLKMHSSGVVTSAPSSSSNMGTKTIEIQSQAQTITNAQVCLDPMTLNDVDYTQVLSTITNGDGTVSILQVDPNNPIITLPDGTTAQVQGVATLHTTQGEGGTVHAVQTIDANGHGENMTVDLTDATLGQDGQIIITGEDGHSYPISVNGMITVPVSASMYQTMIANIQHLHQNGDGTVCLTPMQVQHHSLNNHNTTTTTTTASSANYHENTNNGRLVRAILTGSKAVNNSLVVGGNNTTVTSIGGGGGGVGGVGGIKNESNNNSVVVINDKLHKHIEHADSQHTHAIIDDGGNVKIYFSSNNNGGPSGMMGGGGGSVAGNAGGAQSRQREIKTEFDSEHSVTAN